MVSVKRIERKIYNHWWRKIPSQNKINEIIAMFCSAYTEFIDLIQLSHYRKIFNDQNKFRSKVRRVFGDTKIVRISSRHINTSDNDLLIFRLQHFWTRPVWHGHRARFSSINVCAYNVGYRLYRARLSHVFVMAFKIAHTQKSP